MGAKICLKVEATGIIVSNVPSHLKSPGMEAKQTQKDHLHKGLPPTPTPASLLPRPNPFINAAMNWEMRSFKARPPLCNFVSCNRRREVERGENACCPGRVTSQRPQRARRDTHLHKLMLAGPVQTHIPKQRTVTLLDVKTRWSSHINVFKVKVT